MPFDTSDFDKLYAEMDEQTKALDGVGLRNNKPATPKPKAVNSGPLLFRKSNLPDTTKLELVWDRASLAEADAAGEPVWKEQADCISINKFLLHLTEAAPNFTHNGGMKAYVRLFSKQGHSFDPITAIALHRYHTHYNLAMWDHAANFIGLSRRDAYLLMEATTTRIDEIHMKLRRCIFAALSGRPNDIDWS